MAAEPKAEADNKTEQAREALADLCSRIEERRAAELRRTAGPYPQRLPRASGIEKCARKMQLAIRHWDVRPPFNEWVAARLERGKQIETLAVVPELQRLGFEVVEGQHAADILGRGGRPICTTHIDGKLRAGTFEVVFDAKSMHPGLWAKVRPGPDGMHDLLNDRWGYRYPWQLLLYMYAHNVDAGLFLLDDCLGHWKLVTCCLWDWLDTCEEALARCEAVVDAERHGQLLAFHNDPAVCRECWCAQAGVCSPPLDFGKDGIRILADDHTLNTLTRLDEIRLPGMEYARLDRRLKDDFKKRGAGRYLCGEFLVETAESSIRGHDIPDDVKKQYATTKVRTTTTWRKLEGD